MTLLPIVPRVCFNKHPLTYTNVDPVKDDYITIVNNEA